jgi:dihydroflavonol-4-reductase
LVIGPELNPDSVNTSTQIFTGIFNGKYPGIFSLGWGFVDVRDVAKAHVLGMQKEDAQGRYLLCNQTILMEVSKIYFLILLCLVLTTSKYLINYLI